MGKRFSGSMIGITLGVATLAATALALTEANSAAPRVDPTYAKECGACHMPFPAQYLPKRSWDRILGGLDQHFGENAALPPKALVSVKAYLENHAGDVGSPPSRAMHGVAPGVTPIRITEMPFWVSIHSRPRIEAEMQRRKIKSKSNCSACHKTNADGMIGDDD